MAVFYPTDRRGMDREHLLVRRSRLPHCGSRNVLCGARHSSMPYRCRTCRRFFSVRTGTVMRHSNLGAQEWVIATYMLTTGLKGESRTKLHRDLDITQKSAWHLAHRIRETWERGVGVLGVPVEIDETYMGGKRRTMSNARRKELTGTGRDAVGKSGVIGIKDRSTNQVLARPVGSVDKQTVKAMLVETLDPAACAYTDDSAVYDDLDQRETVNHSVSELVPCMAHTNGIESFWSILKRDNQGTHHKMSAKHLGPNFNEFSGRQNMRMADRLDQTELSMLRMAGKRLRYRDLVQANGLRSGARVVAV